MVELSDGSKITLDEGDNIIGREDTCKIQITSGEASREHTRIDFDKSHGLVWAEDLGSTNGTFLEIRKTTAHQLRRHYLGSGPKNSHRIRLRRKRGGLAHVYTAAPDGKGKALHRTSP